VDRFRILENVRDFRDQLCSETDAAHRARLQKQLVDEEDRLGANAALVDDLDREIDRAIAAASNKKTEIDKSRSEEGGISRTGNLLNVRGQRLSPGAHLRGLLCPLTGHSDRAIPVIICPDLRCGSSARRLAPNA